MINSHHDMTMSRTDDFDLTCGSYIGLSANSILLHCYKSCTYSSYSRAVFYQGMLHHLHIVPHEVESLQQGSTEGTSQSRQLAELLTLSTCYSRSERLHERATRRSIRSTDAQHCMPRYREHASMLHPLLLSMT